MGFFATIVHLPPRFLWAYGRRQLMLVVVPIAAQLSRDEGSALIALYCSATIFKPFMPQNFIESSAYDFVTFARGGFEPFAVDDFDPSASIADEAPRLKYLCRRSLLTHITADVSDDAARLRVERDRLALCSSSPLPPSPPAEKATRALDEPNGTLETPRFLVATNKRLAQTNKPCTGSKAT